MPTRILLFMLLAAPVMAADQASFAVRTHALNPYVAVLDGQWQGIRFASDGNVYFGSSTHAHNHGAAFFRYDPRTGQLKMLCEDISVVCGEQPPKTVPQGKLHSDIVEHAGWLYTATHLGLYTPEGKANYKGAHIVGCELATGRFRDFGVIRANYSCYSAVGVDPRRNCLYAFVTPFDPARHENPGSHLYRIDIATGVKQDLGMLKPGGPHNCFWFFIDDAGDCWFSLGDDGGSLRRVRAGTSTIDRFEDVLPEKAAGAGRWWHWAQPLPGRNQAVFTLFNGNGLWTFDPKRLAADPAAAFDRIADIGYSYLGLAIGGNRICYIQRAGRQKGHQDVDDHHMLSVVWDGPNRGVITDHGLIADATGRRAWRIPALAASASGEVFMAGDWYTRPDEKGSYRHQKGDTYQYIPRGEFFATGRLTPP